MRAIVVNEPGGSECMRIGEVTLAPPGPGEVLVDVAAAGVNFIDVYQRSGLYPLPTPFTPGLEGIGRVAAVGPGSDFAVGQRIGWPMVPGSYAEQVIVPADKAVPVPEDLDDNLAVAALLQGMTAHFLAHSVVPLEPGDAVVVHAGAGGVGLLLTQMLTGLGVRVITTTSTPDKAERSRAAGAELTTSYDDFVEAANEFTRGAGLRAVFDGVGATTFLKGFDALRPRGAMVLFGMASGPVEPLDPQLLNSKGSLYLTRPSLSHYIADREELRWRAGEVFALAAAGRLDLSIGGTYRLDEAANAHDDLVARRTSGKLVLVP